MAPRRPAASASNDKTPVRERPQIRALRLLLRAQARVLDDHRRHVEVTHGLLMTEFDMIAALGNTEGLRMGELANAMITTPGNVTRVAQALEKRGLVERKRSPHSDREVLARLTPTGNEFFRKHFLGVVAFTSAYMDAALSTAEQQQLAGLLTKLLAKPGP
jgi:MarR family 2-MHQ and catechol resistance regulon transcriptional repressor